MNIFHISNRASHEEVTEQGEEIMLVGHNPNTSILQEIRRNLICISSAYTLAW